MNEADRIAALYDRYLGPPQEGSLPLPEGAEFEQMPAGPVPNDILRPHTPVSASLGVMDNHATLDGTAMILSEGDVDAIKKIVAAAIARQVQEDLDTWRRKYALQQEKS